MADAAEARNAEVHEMGDIDPENKAKIAFTAASSVAERSAGVDGMDQEASSLPHLERDAGVGADGMDQGETKPTTLSAGKRGSAGADEMNLDPEQQPNNATIHGIEERDIGIDGMEVKDEESKPKFVLTASSVAQVVKTWASSAIHYFKTWNLDKTVLLITIAAIIIVVAFLLAQCVQSYEQISYASNSERISRTFPGILLCPFSKIRGLGTLANFNSDDVIKPRWTDQATLSFSWITELVQQPGKPDQISGLKIDRKVNDPSTRQQVRACPNYDQNTEKLSYPTSAIYPNVKSDYNPVVTVRNSGVLSVTPPNVECIAFDALLFAKIVPSSWEAACNPLLESVANNADRIYIDLAVAGFKASPNNKFMYTGLIPDWAPADSKNPYPGFKAADSRKIDEITGNGWPELFGGIEAIFYDASQGVPKEINFDHISTTQDGIVFGSTVLTASVQLAIAQDKDYQYKPTKPAAKFYAAISTVFNRTFSNALSGTFADLKYTHEMTTYPQAQNPLSNGFDTSISFDMCIGFASIQSTIVTAYIKVTVLTTITIIFSTAASIWDLQATMKAQLMLVIAKVVAFRKPQDSNP